MGVLNSVYSNYPSHTTLGQNRFTTLDKNDKRTAANLSAFEFNELQKGINYLKDAKYFSLAP